VASYDSRIGGIELRLTELTSSVRLVQAMLGVNLALTAGVFWRVLAH